MSKDEQVKDEGRLNFLKGLGTAIAGAAGVLVTGKLWAKPEEKKPSLTKTSTVSIDLPDVDDVLLTMQAELLRALEKPINERKWGMVLDLRKCVGCMACTVACKSENVLPPGVVYRPVLEETKGKYPNVARLFIPRPCMQCENPPCTPVCPVNATYIREDGTVVIDYNKCIGCRYCLLACPYSARTFDFGLFYADGTPDEAPYEQQSSFEYHERLKRKRGAIFVESSPVGNARKCHFCIHRIENGILPACVTTCIGKATYFGDLNDSESLVLHLSSLPNVYRLKEELGTDPKVFYIT